MIEFENPAAQPQPEPAPKPSGALPTEPGFYLGHIPDGDSFPVVIQLHEEGYFSKGYLSNERLSSAIVSDPAQYGPLERLVSEAVVALIEPTLAEQLESAAKLLDVVRTGEQSAKDPQLLTYTRIIAEGFREAAEHYRSERGV